MSTYMYVQHVAQTRTWCKEMESGELKESQEQDSDKVLQPGYRQAVKY